ncbi:flagellar basal body-associated FliL family protein [Termitidicoccus mucosus]|uniref:Flagellar protein FliL n=1 Tax=Termitidicoccus mucosus TaxID=1184151 RepID=A0A178IHV8_9BACT|nr:hypothetical protein AW736_16310 [Opitutaceae bacterium TSB47]
MPSRIEDTTPATPNTEAAPRSRRALPAWIPLAVAVALAPVLTWAVGRFVLIPQLRSTLATEMPAQARASARPAAGAAPAAAIPGTTYVFDNVVVNLSGTMGTRYLKAGFVVIGNEPTLAQQFEQRRAQLLDVTLNVLSSLSLSDLEEAGAKNLVRERLVSAYNQALGQHVAEQVYFTDFVVQ